MQSMASIFVSFSRDKIIVPPKGKGAYVINLLANLAKLWCQIKAQPHSLLLMFGYPSVTVARRFLARLIPYF